MSIENINHSVLYLIAISFVILIIICIFIQYKYRELNGMFALSLTFIIFAIISLTMVYFHISRNILVLVSIIILMFLLLAILFFWYCYNNTIKELDEIYDDINDNSITYIFNQGKDNEEIIKLAVLKPSIDKLNNGYAHDELDFVRDYKKLIDDFENKPMKSRYRQVIPQCDGKCFTKRLYNIYTGEIKDEDVIDNFKRKLPKKVKDKIKNNLSNCGDICVDHFDNIFDN